MKIDINLPVVGLDGKPVSDESLARVLASELVRSNATPSVLVLGWAELLWENKPLELEEKEVDGLIALIEALTRLPVLVRARAVRHILAQKK